MPILPQLTSFWRNLFKRRRVEGDLDDELHTYLDQLTDEKRQSGMSPREARRAAAIELGGVEQVKEEVRQVQSNPTHDGSSKTRKSNGFSKRTSRFDPS
jgi:hypothetical protein